MTGLFTFDVCVPCVNSVEADGRLCNKALVQISSETRPSPGQTFQAVAADIDAFAGPHSYGHFGISGEICREDVHIDILMLVLGVGS